MAINYQTISTLPTQEEMTENTFLVCEENGETKKIPANAVGGGGSIKTAIIKSSDYDSSVESMKTAVAPSAVGTTYECLNMTFEEAYEILAAGQPLMVYLMHANDGYPCNIFGEPHFMGVASTGTPTIEVAFYYMYEDEYLQLTWTTSGLSDGGGESPS